MVSGTPISGSSPYSWLVGLVDAEPWMQGTPCGQTDPDLFFPENDGDWKAPGRAKAICATCDVREQCLEFALRTKQRHGIWGGVSARSLVAMRTA